MKIALAHHWLTTYRGGEKVLEELCLLFRDAPILTLVADGSDLPSVITEHPLIASRLQWIPGAKRYYKQLFPLHAWAFSNLVAPEGVRLLFSSDASMVKGVRLPAGAEQICYCHSPPRYIWDRSSDYSRSMGPLSRAIFERVCEKAKMFDAGAARTVSHFVANSHFVAKRIEYCYNRDSEVIHPPVRVADFDWMKKRDDFYLIVSQLVPYKRVDIAVRAFSNSGRRLVVIGEGSEMTKLKAIAGRGVDFLGRQPFAVVKDHFERCRAFIYPQVEDFGITAVEAQAAGAPVLAFRVGGALESVVEGQTGVFFDEQNEASLMEGVRAHERMEGALTPEICRRNSERFAPDRFRRKIVEFTLARYPELKDSITSDE